MFQVVHNQTGEVLTVYGMNGPHFMFWNEKEQYWYYGDSDDYKPLAACAASPA